MQLRLHHHRGMELTMIIVIMGMLAAIGLAMLQIVSSQNILSSREIRQQQLFQVAEAGVNYYRWRLAHYPNDYQDGTASAGPYIHDFTDTTGTVIGRYELTITPPVTGSTIATISSSAYLLSHPNARRVVTVRLGIPSLSKYAVVANADMRFGEGTETFGPVHSNGGIHFDGIAHGLVSSAEITYTDPDGYGDKPGVWSLNNEATTFLGGKQIGVTSIDFNGITTDLSALRTLASSPSGILLPASGVQGYHLTFKANDTVDIRKVATQVRCQWRSGTGSCSLGQCSTGSCSLGSCSLRVCSNNASRTCTRDSNCQGSGTCRPAVTCSNSAQCPANGTCTINNSCSNNNQCPSGDTCSRPYCASSTQCSGSATCTINGSCSNDSDCINGGTCGNMRSFGFCSNNFNTSCTQDSTCGSGNTCIFSSFSVGTRASDQIDYQLNVPLPANGIIFVPEDVWVDGIINTARVTVVAAAEPIASGKANIYITNDLRYTNTDGRDVIGLIAQNNILVGYFSENDLRIDAAMIAQKGRIGRPFYGQSFIGAVAGSNFQLYPTDSTLPNGGGGENSCDDFRTRNSLTSYGSLATNQRYGFAWTGSNLYSCGGGDYNNSGYCDRSLSFDTNLIFAPPPSFPTSGEYSIISYVER